jgi:hypothetical protein
LFASILFASPGAWAQCTFGQLDYDYNLGITQLLLDRLLVDPNTQQSLWSAPVNPLWQQIPGQQGPGFLGVDNSGDGIQDDDHFDLLAAIIDGDASVVAGLDPGDVATIRAAYDANAAYLQTREITINNVNITALIVNITRNVTTGGTVDVPIVGATDIPSLWGVNEANPDDGLLSSADPNLERLLIDLGAGYMTIGGTTNVDYLQAFVAQITLSVIRFVLPALLSDLKSAAGIAPDAEWQLISANLVDEAIDDKAFTVSCTGIQAIDVTVDVEGISARIRVPAVEICNALQRFVDEFNCTAFDCLPELLSASGDLDGDGTSNLDSFDASADRQEFLANESIANPPLQITTMPADVNVLAGAAVSIPLPLAGGQEGGTASYRWDITDSESLSPTLQIATSASLDYPYAVPGNTAYYTGAACDNLWVRRSVPFDLIVGAQAFQITAQPVGILDRAPGDSHTLNVAVTGGALPPTFQWQFSADDTVYDDIDGATSATLVLDPLELADSGYYQCVITGDDGAKAVAVLTSDPAFVEVTDRIRFGSQPEGGSIYVGDEFSFEVVVNGTPDGVLEYVWRLDSNDLADSDAATYTVTDATLLDAGDYTVVISDDTYEFESDPATLIVAERMSIAEPGQPVGGIEFEGQPFTFSVVVDGGLPPFTYIWKKGGDAIDGAPNSADYTIASLALADGGTYSVEVQDREDTIVSADAVLTVIPPFEITTQPTGAKKFSGSEHTFSIDVVGGAPPFSFQWLKDGNPFGPPRVAADRNLVLTDIQTDDSGSYRCAVSDENGTKLSSIAVLDVRNRIAFTEQPQDVALYRGSSATISAPVSGGFGTLEYAWRRGTVVVSLASSLAITNAQSFAAGTYTLTVTDKDGATTLDTIVSDPFTITVGDPVEITSQPQDAWRFETDEVTFTVGFENGAGDVSFEWFHDGNPIADSDSASITLTGLAIDDSGEYTCVITDGIQSYPTEVAELTVIEELAPIGADVNVNLTAAQVVPPSGLLASGVGQGSIAPASGKLAGQYLVIMNVVHTLQNGVAAQIRRGEPGENGPFVEDIGAPAPPIAVFEVLNSREAAELMSGVHYMVITTEAFPDGAIRGQMIPTRRDPVEEGEGEGIVEGEGEGVVEGEGEGTVEGDGEPEGEGEGLAEGEGEGIDEGEGETDAPEVIAARLLLEGFILGDTNPRDGRLSGAETVGILPAIGPEIFELLDANGDDVLQPSELLALGGNVWIHSGDLNASGRFSLSELLRAVQLFNRGTYSCAANAGASEDGFVAQAGATCDVPHAADYENGGDFSLSLAELLRLIQLYNAGGYEYCPGQGSDDGYCVAE